MGLRKCQVMLFCFEVLFPTDRNGSCELFIHLLSQNQQLPYMVSVTDKNTVILPDFMRYWYTGLHSAQTQIHQHTPNAKLLNKVDPSVALQPQKP